MTPVLRSRTRYPGPVNFDVRNCISWQTAFSGSWGPFSMTKSGAIPWIDCGDGTVIMYGDYHTFPDGSTKNIRMWSPDGWDGLTAINLAWGSNTGKLPRFPGCKNLNSIGLDNNTFTDGEWNYDELTALQSLTLQSNTAIGGFDASTQHWGLNTALQYLNLDGGNFSGTIPDFTNCTALTYCYYGGGGTTTDFVHGSFQTQANLYLIGFWNHNWATASIVNAMLHDCVVSLGLGSRVTCELQLHGGSMAAPTGQGITDKATLVSAGWTVYTN